MKPKCFFLITTFIIITSGCQKPVPKYDDSWSVLRIISEHSNEFTIENNVDNDSVMVRFFHSSSIFYKNPKEGQIDTSYVLMKKPVRDSIGLLVQQLISSPAKPKGFCSEYVGSLYLLMRYGDNQLEQTSRYSSVCDWSKLSDTTARLSNLLENVVKLK